MKNNYCVYKHTCPNGEVYYGITSKDPEKRWLGGKGYAGNKRFYNLILEYGWRNIKHEILFSGISNGEALRIESALIKEGVEKYKSKLLNACYQTLPEKEPIVEPENWYDNIRDSVHIRVACAEFEFEVEAWDNLDRVFGTISTYHLLQSDYAVFRTIVGTPTTPYFLCRKINYPDGLLTYEDLINFFSEVELDDFEIIDEKSYWSELHASIEVLEGA